jgi:valyl-tRNA synthetase
MLVDELKKWEEFAPYIKRLAWADPLEISVREPDVNPPAKALASVAKGAEVFLPLAGVINIDEEIKRLEKLASEIEEDVLRTEERLSNQEFLTKAPEDIVEKQKKRRQENIEKLETVKKRISMLNQIRIS